MKALCGPLRAVLVAAERFLVALAENVLEARPTAWEEGYRAGYERAMNDADLWPRPPEEKP